MAAKTREPVIQPLEAVAKLWRFGYFGNPETVPLEKVLEDATASKVRAAVRHYQKFNGLKADGWLGPKTARLMLNPLRCGLPDMMAAGECAWPMKRISYHTRLQLGIQTAARAFDEAAQLWNNVCGAELVRVNTIQCNILADEGSGQRDNMDGRGGTLGWSYLPCGAKSNTRLQQKYDSAERWSHQMLVTVAAHELGHALGLPHLKNGNLLQPYYDPNIPVPQAGDIAEVVRRYGKPAANPTPPPGPAPTPGDNPYVEITVTVGGVKFVASGNTKAIAGSVRTKKRK